MTAHIHHTSQKSMATGSAWGRLLTIAFLCFVLNTIVFLQDVTAAADIQVSINGGAGGGNEVYVEDAGGNPLYGPCNGICDYSPNPNPSVQFRAVAGEPGYMFSHWSGPGVLDGSTSLTSPVIVLPPVGTVSVTANFVLIDYTLTVTSAGGTGGTTDRVTVSAPGPYHYGDIVTLTANPQAGETFSSWGGDLGGSNNPETITINANKTVEANFAFIDYALTVTSAGGTGGTTDRVTVSAPGPYHYGTLSAHLNTLGLLLLAAPGTPGLRRRAS